MATDKPLPILDNVQLEEVTEPVFGFESIGQELFFRRKVMERESDYLDRLKAFALRVEPVCRNCIHCGPLTYNGNYPYNSPWGSCRKGPPVAGPDERIEQYTNANTARWPSVRHDGACGDFKLAPVRNRPSDLDRGEPKWQWQELENGRD